MTSFVRFALGSAAGLLLCSCGTPVSTAAAANSADNAATETDGQPVPPVEPRDEFDGDRVEPADPEPEMPEPEPDPGDKAPL